MYVWQQDYDRARHYTKMTQDKFLQVMFIELYTHYTKMARDKFLQVMFIELYTRWKHLNFITLKWVITPNDSWGRRCEFKPCSW
jgi:hypothetical protein